MVEDLARSGLTYQDINARPIGDPERAAIDSPAADGYAIPYYSVRGELQAFYRVRLFDQPVKYRQPRNNPTYLYIPKGFQAALQRSQLRCVIICEGEKKAAACTKAGIPAVALGGVDAWKNRTMVLPAQTELARANYRTKEISAKIPQGAADPNEGTTVLAYNLLELIDEVIGKNLSIIIVFDTDSEQGIKFEVQRAAASLGFELRHRGVPFKHIRQMMLPPDKGKVGLDDFIMSQGADALYDLVTKNLLKRSAFPKHPNIREFVNRKLQKSQMSRKEAQSVSLAILSDLDSNGQRLRSTTSDRMYYFDNYTRILQRAGFNFGQRGQLHETPFGQHLYRQYGLSAADSRILTWLDAQFNSEETIMEVEPYRVIARPDQSEDSVRYQINDGQYIKVTASREEPMQILDNGEEGVLFESGFVEPMDAATLEAEFNMQLADTKGFYARWNRVLESVRLADPNYSKQLVTLLYYLSPWLNRWRGMQLPVELVIGEAGSGKSSLYSLRLGIITGHPDLRNAPNDLKDWHASIANSGGLHVVDNVQLVDKNLRQRLSDDLCRIVTEPVPTIEMRRLYTEAELMRIPITSTFAITAIKQPFLNADILQRSIIIALDKSIYESKTFDGDWVDRQMEDHGGRIAWVAHHMVVLHKFFQNVEMHWKNGYRAQHRLVNLEQSLRIMAITLGMDHDWIPNVLTTAEVKAVSEADWILEGLAQFARITVTSNPNRLFSTADIANWALGHEDYQDNNQLTSARSLGKYIQSHKDMIRAATGIVEAGLKANRMIYRVQEKS